MARVSIGWQVHYLDLARYGCENGNVSLFVLPRHKAIMVVLQLFSWICGHIISGTLKNAYVPSIQDYGILVSFFYLVSNGQIIIKWRRHKH